MENYIKLEAIKKELTVLIGDGENIEYTRGALEIISSFISYGEDNSHAENCLALAKEIGLSEEVISQLY